MIEYRVRIKVTAAKHTSVIHFQECEVCLHMKVIKILTRFGACVHLTFPPEMQPEQYCPMYWFPLLAMNRNVVNKIRAEKKQLKCF